MKNFNKTRLIIYFTSIAFILVFFLRDISYNYELSVLLGLLSITGFGLFIALLIFSIILAFLKETSMQELWLYIVTFLFLIFLTLTVIISSLNSAARFREQDAIKRYQKK